MKAYTLKELTIYSAVRLPSWGHIGNDYNSTVLACIELFDINKPGDLDKESKNLVIEARRSVLDARYLPLVSRDFVRGNHSVLHGDTAQERMNILLTIIKNGLTAQPESTGKYSEDPHTVFAIADAPVDDRLYNRNMPYVSFDLPIGKHGDWGIIRDDDYRPGSVMILNSVPSQYIVGINGVTVKDFLEGVMKWDVASDIPRRNPSLPCRMCGVCCTEISISSPIPGMPHGKEAGKRCIWLRGNLCSLFGDPRRPRVCSSYSANTEFCGHSAEEAEKLIRIAERETKPRSR